MKTQNLKMLKTNLIKKVNGLKTRLFNYFNYLKYKRLNHFKKLNYFDSSKKYSSLPYFWDKLNTSEKKKFFNENIKDMKAFEVSEEWQTYD